MMAAFVLLLAALSPADDRVAGIVQLGRLWGEVRTLHPDLAASGVDWDLAFVHALRNLQTGNGFISATAEMLAQVHDPATRLLGPAVRRATPRLSQRWASQGVLLVTAGL